MMRRLVRNRHVLAGSLLFGMLAACNSDSTKPPTPAAVTAVSGPALTGTVGEFTSTPLTVRVTDAGGTALSNQTVTFSVTDGGGTVSPTTVTTSSTGEATATWRLGQTAGVQRAQAVVAGVSTGVTFTASAEAGAPSTVAVSAGDNQSAAAGSVVTTAPAIVVRDRFQNPVAGVSVVYSIIAGNGTLTSPGATTNASGVATANGWRLGTAVGPNRLSALVVASGVASNPIVFTANGTAGAAAGITPLSSTTISAVVGTTVTPLPSVRLVDASGNPVAGAQVNFTGSAGSTVSGNAKLTDANGIATVDSWLLGGTAGNYTLTATSGTLTAAVFTATARAASAASVSVAGGNNQSVTVGRPVAVEPSVRVVDAFGNPIGGVEVVFDVISGGGTAVSRRPLTNANGVAEVGGWTLGDTPGTNTLRATVTGNGIANNPITFTATATAGVPTTVTIQAGNNQSALAGTVLPVSPSVVVRDSRGNPVSGATVNFLIGSGGGSVTPASVTTNASGIATVSSWTIGTAVGAQTLIARVAGVPDVVFNASATAGAPSNVTAATLTNIGLVTVNGFVSPTPAVRVTDAAGNPVQGVLVTFALDAGTGSAITGASQNTGADGVATLGAWRVGTVAGETARVRATVAGLTIPAGSEPQFTATTAAAAPFAINVAPGSVQSQGGTASTAVATVPAVRVTDSFGNPVANQLVTFSVATGNGTIGASASSVLVSTDANGVATSLSWTLPAGGTVTRTLTATLNSNPALTINFTAVVP